MHAFPIGADIRKLPMMYIHYGIYSISLVFLKKVELTYMEIFHLGEPNMWLSTPTLGREVELNYSCRGWTCVAEIELVELVAAPIVPLDRLPNPSLLPTKPPPDLAPVAAPPIANNPPTQRPPMSYLAALAPPQCPALCHDASKSQVCTASHFIDVGSEILGLALPPPPACTTLP